MPNHRLDELAETEADWALGLRVCDTGDGVYYMDGEELSVAMAVSLPWGIQLSSLTGWTSAAGVFQGCLTEHAYFMGEGGRWEQGGVRALTVIGIILTVVGRNKPVVLLATGTGAAVGVAAVGVGALLCPSGWGGGGRIREYLCVTCRRSRKRRRLQKIRRYGPYLQVGGGGVSIG